MLFYRLSWNSDPKDGIFSSCDLDNHVWFATPTKYYTYYSHRLEVNDKSFTWS